MKCGEAFRIVPGRDITQKLLATLPSLGLSLGNPRLTMDIIDLSVGAVGTILIAIMLEVKKQNAKNWRKDIEYGSARWGTSEDIEPFVDPAPQNNIILTATESLTLNGRPKNPKHSRNKNVLIVGGSGSGKTRFFVKPNLMQLHSSYVVTDPKGQLIVETGRLLQKNGYEIKILNTIDFRRSMHYNPFAYIRSEKDILKLVNALILNTKGEGKQGEDFWVKAETLLYCALIGYIYYETAPADHHLNSLIDMLNAMEAREDNEDYKHAIDFLFEDLAARDPNHFAVRQYTKYKMAAGKTAKSILISCGARLAVFDIAEVRDLLSYDEMELDTIGDRKTALFIIISDTDDTFSFIVALMYSQLFDTLCAKADRNPNGRLKVHVRMLLDEFANIGQIPRFERLIATIRSREISACVVLQAQTQLKQLYKDAAEVIIGNMDSRIFLGGSEKTTLKDLTESLGKETVYMLNNGNSRGNSPSFSQNEQKVGRELMSVDELSVMDGDKCILQIRGVRPFLSAKYDITRHRNYRHLADANPKNAFDVAAYLSTRLKVNPDEDFTYMGFFADEEGQVLLNEDDYPEDLEPIAF